MDKELPTVEVVTGKTRSLGALYMRAMHHLILLNNVVEGVDLGPLKVVRMEHIEPEASLLVIPLAMVTAINPVGRSA